MPQIFAPKSEWFLHGNSRWDFLKMIFGHCVQDSKVYLYRIDCNEELFVEPF